MVNFTNIFIKINNWVCCVVNYYLRSRHQTEILPVPSLCLCNAVCLTKKYCRLLKKHYCLFPSEVSSRPHLLAEKIADITLWPLHYRHRILPTYTHTFHLRHLTELLLEEEPSSHQVKKRLWYDESPMYMYSNKYLIIFC